MRAGGEATSRLLSQILEGLSWHSHRFFATGPTSLSGFAAPGHQMVISGVAVRARGVPCRTIAAMDSLPLAGSSSSVDSVRSSTGKPRWRDVAPFWAVHIAAAIGAVMAGWSWAAFAWLVGSYCVRMFAI